MIYLHSLYKAKVKKIYIYMEIYIYKRTKASKWFMGIKKDMKIYPTLLVVKEIQIKIKYYIFWPHINKKIKNL